MTCSIYNVCREPLPTDDRVFGHSPEVRPGLPGQEGQYGLSSPFHEIFDTWLYSVQTSSSRNLDYRFHVVGITQYHTYIPAASIQCLHHKRSKFTINVWTAGATIPLNKELRVNKDAGNGAE